MTQSLLLQERQLESHGRHARPLRYAAAAHAVASPFALHVAIESLAPAVVLQHVVLQTPLAQSPHSTSHCWDCLQSLSGTVDVHRYAAGCLRNLVANNGA